MWSLLVLLVVGIGFVWNLIAWPKPRYDREVDAQRERQQAALMAARLRSGNGTVR